MLGQARNLLHEKGILSKPDRREEKSLPQETIEQVQNFIAMMNSAE